MRRSAGYAWAAVAVAAVTGIGAPLHAHLNDTTVALALLLVVQSVASWFGSRPALLASVLGMGCFNFFFLPPLYTFTIADPQNWVALTAFFVTALSVGQLSARFRRRTAELEADRNRLRESEANLHRAQAVAHLGSWHLNIPKGELTWSAEVFRIFGIPDGTPLTYASFLMAIHPDDRAGVERAWAAALAGAPYDVEHRILVVGQVRWVRERAKVEFDGAGQAVDGIGTVQDITQRKQAEHQIRTLNTELEARVLARTAELEAANQLKDELLVRQQTTAADLAVARDREMSLGSRIQQMLLLDPPPLDIPGLEVAALTLPSQYIDGDFYDFFIHQRQCMDLAVADVMGKGVPAALLAAATKSHFLDALCHLLSLSQGSKLPEPKEIVTLAHANMARHLIDLESFVTMCYMRLDLERQVAVLVDCGHTGVIHHRPRAERCELIHGDNLPLGVRVGEIYNQIALPFEPGDTFLFFSDGVTETRNPAGEQFGAQRLVELVEVSSKLDPKLLLATIRRATGEFANSERIADDLTCVAIRILEHERPLEQSRLSLPSEVGDLPRARQFVRSACASLPSSPLDEAGTRDLELAVSEAARRIVELSLSRSQRSVD